MARFFAIGKKGDSTDAAGRTARLQAAFELCDRNKSGFLEVSDIGAVCKAFDPNADVASGTAQVLAEFGVRPGAKDQRITPDMWTSTLMKTLGSRDSKVFDDHIDYLERALRGPVDHPPPSAKAASP
ncbi:hypothetical protein PBRA_008302 [Plasmodiophora brassicae]|uniref:EF-hand domain-containing protein n=1 Tax=Plasmodiophora brassicae TaxID=37360 RepID=A0A0G4J079_PLABS|nr:hypothetical protein PBRA_008302 [Plasmodiophora brassicae]